LEKLEKIDVYFYVPILAGSYAASHSEMIDRAFPSLQSRLRLGPCPHARRTGDRYCRLNRLGRYSDDAGRASSRATIYVAQRHTNFGEFKAPSLRNLTLTAPYMHNGSKATLEDVVRHCSEIDMERLYVDG
jgi:cytochrome c peroxidase